MANKKAGTVAALALIGFMSSNAVQAQQFGQQPATPTDEQIALFTNVLFLAEQIGVNNVGYDKMLAGALEGALQALDPHSSYISAEDFKEMQTAQSGQFGGIGADVMMERGALKIIAPHDGSPADKARLQAGDYITHIDGQALSGMATNDAVKILRGAPGTTVNLTVYREGAPDLLQIPVTREIIQIKTVRHAEIDGDIGYVRLANFSDENGDVELSKAFNAMPNKRAYILDLRNNPGGLVDQAVKMADLFLDNKEEIVSTRGRNPAQNESYHATPGDILNGKPLIVLTNNGSASASEILAAALQDHKRATVLGTQSFGKGSMQAVIPLARIVAGREDAIKITTALHHRPDGTTIQNTGVTPDTAYEAPGAKPARAVTEAQLPGTIANPNGDKKDDRTTAICAPADANADGKGLDKDVLDRDGKPDFQLLCAVESLSGKPALTKTAPVVKAPQP